MRSRKITHGRRKSGLLRRLLIGALFSIVLVGGSVGMAYADSDISSLLTHWFNKQSEEAVAEIDRSIDQEREKQTKRLKEELQLEIEAADETLKEFTKEEIEKRTESLKRHADELIANFDGDEGNTSPEKDKIMKQLDQTFNEAIQQMNDTVEGFESNSNNEQDASKKEEEKDSNKKANKDKDSSNENDQEQKEKNEDAEQDKDIEEESDDGGEEGQK